MNTGFQWRRLLLSFADENHKYKPYPEYVGKCEWSLIFQLRQVYPLKLWKPTHGKADLPIISGALSAIISAFLECDLLPVGSTDVGPMRKRRNMVPCTQEKSVPCPHGLRATQGSTSHIHEMQERSSVRRSPWPSQGTSGGCWGDKVTTLGASSKGCTKGEGGGMRLERATGVKGQQGHVEKCLEDGHTKQHDRNMGRHRAL